MGTKTTSKGIQLVAPADASMREWAETLVARSRAEGVDLVGADVLLTALLRTVLQTGMEVELAEHLGHEPNDQATESPPKLSTRSKRDMAPYTKNLTDPQQRAVMAPYLS